MVEYLKYTPCRICKGKKGPAEGFFYEKLNGKDISVECDCHKKWREANDVIRRMNESGINGIYSFDDYRGTKSEREVRALRYFAEYPEKFLNRKMIYIYGDKSCQKTSMAQALGKSIIEKGYSVKYCLMPDLLVSLLYDYGASQELKQSRDSFVEKCANVDFLILDESFDRSKASVSSTGWQTSFIDRFIRNRFEILGKTIIFISNVNVNEIEGQGFSSSLEELIKRNTNGSFLHFKDNRDTNSLDSLGLFAGVSGGLV